MNQGALPPNSPYGADECGARKKFFYRPDALPHSQPTVCQSTKGTTTTTTKTTTTILRPSYESTCVSKKPHLRTARFVGVLFYCSQQIISSHTICLTIIMTSVCSNLAKGRIADLSSQAAAN